MTRLNVSMPNNKASKKAKQKWIKPQREKVKSTITLGVFKDLPPNNRMLIANTILLEMVTPR